MTAFIGIYNLVFIYTERFINITGLIFYFN